MLKKIAIVLYEYKILKRDIINITIRYIDNIRKYIQNSKFEDLEYKAIIFSRNNPNDIEKYNQIVFNLLSDYFGFIPHHQILEFEKEIKEYLKKVTLDINDNFRIGQIFKEIVDYYIFSLNQFPLEGIPYDSEVYHLYENLIKENSYSINSLTMLIREWFSN